MTKKMLIDDTQPEETRVVIVDGNKIEDVEFESTSRKQIKGNIYTAKVVRIEPSLQAAFIDYGTNKHGFLAFSEIHPDYYNIDPAVVEAVEKDVDEIIERKKQYLKERAALRAKIRAEKKAAYEARKAAEEAAAAEEESLLEETSQILPEEPLEETPSEEAPKPKRKYSRRKKEEPEVFEARAENEDDYLDETSDDVNDESDEDSDEDIDIDVSPENEVEFEHSFELQRKLIRARKLYHNSTIQDVIKEGQVMLVQVVKEERGNKGAAFTTYLSLAGRYGVLMPNRIKSGGVSRKITNALDRKRLKDIIKNLPLSSDMSLIIRTAGEDQPEEEIIKDYNYLIRTWNQIRLGALKNKVPSLIYEEGDLIKRALRDMCSKDIAEILVDGDAAYKAARDFLKILSPQSLRKIKCRRPYEAPLFQRYQIEAQLDKLHNPIVQLESGGYLVINPTEALVSIDVNSGRATKELDIEETALNTNLEAADEIARQLKMRDLAGLVVVDFIDMEDVKNNIAVERRMKEALKNDRARVQIAKMSCFGLLEISRQRMHSSFVESNYEPCPYCHGQGVMRTIESGSTLILRAIEEECTKNRFAVITVYVPTDTAVYLLNQKRKQLAELEGKYNLSVVIAADTSIKNVSDYKIERTRLAKPVEEAPKELPASTYSFGLEETGPDLDSLISESEESDISQEDQPENHRYGGRFNRRRSRFNRRRRYGKSQDKEKPVLLYSSDPDVKIPQSGKKEEKTTWWRRLIG